MSMGNNPRSVCLGCARCVFSILLPTGVCAYQVLSNSCMLLLTCSSNAQLVLVVVIHPVTGVLTVCVLTQRMVVCLCACVTCVVGGGASPHPRGLPSQRCASMPLVGPNVLRCFDCCQRRQSADVWKALHISLCWCGALMHTHTNVGFLFDP